MYTVEEFAVPSSKVLRTRKQVKTLADPDNDLVGKEIIVANIASRIFAAYMAQGKVNPESTFEWIDRSIRMALRMIGRTKEMIDMQEQGEEYISEREHSEILEVFRESYETILE